MEEWSAVDLHQLDTLFDGHATALAPALLGCRLTVVTVQGAVTVRLTEVEAYGDQGEDPGAHSFRGRTARNDSLFGPPRRTYVYLNYGIHRCLNLACGPEGTAGGVLLRAGEVLAGRGLAVERRGRDTGVKLLSGPGRLGQGLGITLTMDAAPVTLVPPEAPQPADPDPEDVAFLLSPPGEPVGERLWGPRVGVSGVGGGPEFPWRCWLAGEASVSAYRPGRDVPAREVLERRQS
ncbi:MULTISPECIES: DNA-3-methyladenine glycosylase [unclassified Nesterenkonia]|uniref:DNA-3-methyladenine glycosylase n=1 Tax=unclassified Nesterenkonia TaxID=2629769 RepID=UPI0009F4B4AE|nr:DNA-3-methyladenine glycosylase [Nesterenkonia sp. PF2B19]OSM43267.1 3-methyladenine DNA glycosylase [Nesterenkonia sp. PF2B19]